MSNIQPAANEAAYIRDGQGVSHPLCDLKSREDIQTINTDIEGLEKDRDGIKKQLENKADKKDLVTYEKGNENTAGLVKLYSVTGSNYDGAMTQKAVTDELNKKAEKTHSHSLDKNDITGVLPLNKGGTGATTAAGARTKLGLGTAAQKGVATAITENNTNLVTSGVVYAALQEIRETIEGLRQEVEDLKKNSGSGSEPQPAVKFTVTYKGYGANGDSVSSVSVESGSTTELISPGERSGYSFSYWECDKDSGHHTQGEVYRVTQDVTFTAKWMENSPSEDDRDYENVFDTKSETGTISQSSSYESIEKTSTTFKIKTGDEIEYTVSFAGHSDAGGTKIDGGSASIDILGKNNSQVFNSVSGILTETITADSSMDGEFFKFSASCTAAEMEYGDSNYATCYIQDFSVSISINDNEVYTYTSSI